MLIDILFSGTKIKLLEDLTVTKDDVDPDLGKMLSNLNTDDYWDLDNDTTFIIPKGSVLLIGGLNMISDHYPEATNQEDLLYHMSLLLDTKSDDDDDDLEFTCDIIIIENIKKEIIEEGKLIRKAPKGVEIRKLTELDEISQL